MAKFTLTSTTVRNLTVIRDFGLNVAYSEYRFQTEDHPSSMSQTIYVHMIPLPNGARVLDGYLRVTGAGDGAIQAGVVGTLSTFINLTSVATDPQLTRFNVPNGIGYKMSLTASDVNSYSNVIATAVLMNTSSATMTFAMCVYYAVEDQI